MSNIRWLSFITLIFALSSCSHPQLSLFSTYSIRENLASYRVRTPDPSLNCPTLGQHIYVNWHLNRHYSLPVELKLFVRFGDRTETQENFYLTTHCGFYVYSLLNDDFFQKNGIVAFKAELLDTNGSIIQEWRHQLWVDRIVFVEKTDNESKKDLTENDDEKNSEVKKEDTKEKIEEIKDKNTEKKENKKTSKKKSRRKRRKSKKKKQSSIEKNSIECELLKTKENETSTNQ